MKKRPNVPAVEKDIFYWFKKITESDRSSFFDVYPWPVSESSSRSHSSAPAIFVRQNRARQVPISSRSTPRPPRAKPEGQRFHKLLRQVLPPSRKKVRP